jgi:hypothetical protein
MPNAFAISLANTQLIGEERKVTQMPTVSFKKGIAGDGETGGRGRGGIAKGMKVGMRIVRLTEDWWKDYSGIPITTKG